MLMLIYIIDAWHNWLLLSVSWSVTDLACGQVVHELRSASMGHCYLLLRPVWDKSVKPHFRPIVPSHLTACRKKIKKISAILLIDYLIPHASFIFVVTSGCFSKDIEDLSHSKLWKLLSILPTTKLISFMTYLFCLHLLKQKWKWFGLRTLVWDETRSQTLVSY